MVVGSTGEFCGGEVGEFVQGGASEVDGVEPVDCAFVSAKVIF